MFTSGYPFTLRPHGVTDGLLVNDCELEADRVANLLVELWQHEPNHRPHNPKGTGGTLPAYHCNFFGRYLGHNFHGVRIHADHWASEIAGSMGIAAFTVGANIVFATDQFSPHTSTGLRLIAHELVHVVQQGAVPKCGPFQIPVRQRVATSLQCKFDPQRIYRNVCPPGTTAQSYPSDSVIGTAYGKYLGLMYMRERSPKTYGLVDFWIWVVEGSWKPGTIYELWKFDPGVSLALMAHEFTRWGFQRTDILDSDRDEVYEIKPVRSAADGPPQLAAYLSQLTLTAPTTSPFFGPTRPRKWKGGTWDPSRYPIVIPGKQGQVCLIHAWRDPKTQGLLLYDIVCCVPDPDKGEQEFTATAVTSVERHISAMRPQLEESLKDFLPKAPPGSVYAFLATPRFFETYVLGPWRTEQDRMLEKAFGIQPGPIFKRRLLETFVLGHVVTRGVTDLLFVWSGFMEGKEVAKLWGFEMAMGAAVCGGIFLAFSEVAAGVAAGAAWAVPLEETVAAETAVAPLAEGEGLLAETLEATAEGPLINGSAIGEAVEIGRTAAPWMVNAPGASSGLGTGIGLGVVGAVLTVAGEAEASPGTEPGPARIAGADPICLAPTELLVPKRGKIEVAAEVTYGDQTFFIIALVKAG